jgi:GH15 family glucan-1,4-alpha-glucosidase
MAAPIEDYAVIGDRHTAALISLHGSVDWLCLPRFDSPSCFSALLGNPENGRWLLAPEDEDAVPTRRYVDGTSVLETTWRTDDAEIVVTDLMPPGNDRADLVRTVQGVRGTMRLRHEWIVRPDYARIVPWVTHDEDAEGEAVLSAVAGPDRLLLRGPRLPRASEWHHEDVLDVHEGEELSWSTVWTWSWVPIPPRADPDESTREAIEEEQYWADHVPTDVPYADLVRRSLLTLHLLTHSATGGIVAAPTTSLPETFGGGRNWDYRYCWLRDAALSLEALLAAGYREESRAWRDWLLRAVAGDPADLQIMYAVDGARRLPELELDHLPGYEGSRPVRIGNGAVGQHQADVLGEVMIALEDARRAGVREEHETWSVQHTLVEDLEDNWDIADHGLWEIRGPERYFTHSMVMTWAAFDRAVRAVEEHGLDGPVERWRECREQVRTAVMRRGWSEERGTFTQHDETTEVDASLLVIPLVGFLPGDDPHVLGTIAAVEEDLLRDGLVLRYRTSSGVDGLEGDEHPFLACSFWLVQAYAAAGRTEDAHRLMKRLCGLANDVGLLSEEYDVDTGRMAGNFPQAFSHLALVQAALSLRG